ncbi:MAG: AI-2E family transporter [Clostridiales bacterium]|nr:AI-2E family transporter [Clostridiales bacterium]
MKKLKNDYLSLMLALFGAAALTLLLYYVLFHFGKLLSGARVLMKVWAPFVVGGVIAYILKPTCNSLEAWLTGLLQKPGSKAEVPLDGRGKSSKLAGGLSIALTLVLALVVIAILLILVVPTLLDSIRSVMRLIPGSVERFSDWLLLYVGDNETLSNYITQFSGGVSTSLPEWLISTVLPNLETLVGGVSSGVASAVNILSNLFLGIIAAIYILGFRKTFARQAKKLNYSVFGKRWSEIILREFRFADRAFSGFISGRLIDSLIIGIICFIGMLILRMPYAVLVSVIVGVTNVIPFFGPYIGMIPSFLLILMVSPVKSLIFLVFILVLQQFDGNYLGPRILGNVTGLSSFWVLFAIITFGGLFGFGGVLVGVPVFAVIYDILRQLVNKGVSYHRAKEAETAPPEQ